MDKFFVCLANSYKHGGRCIAGVEVVLKENRIEVITLKGNPKWIRPVCRYSDAGAIPNDIALNIALFDIVRMTNVELCPNGAQSENAFYDELTSTGLTFDSAFTENLLVNNSHRHLFYNYGKAVTPETYQQKGTYSIVLIKAENAEVYEDTTYTDYPRYRIVFSYNDHTYDFPITDPEYIQGLRNGKIPDGKKGTLYVACSLGVEHEGMHSKLAAGIIEPSSIETLVDETKAYSVDKIRETYEQAYAKWTPEADEELGILYDAGVSVKQLMKVFGRNEGAIKSRLIKIGKIK